MAATGASLGAHLGLLASAAECAASLCPSDYVYPAPSEVQLERLRSQAAAGGPGGSQSCAMNKGSLFGGSQALHGEQHVLLFLHGQLTCSSLPAPPSRTPQAIEACLPLLCTATPCAMRQLGFQPHGSFRGVATKTCSNCYSCSCIM